MESIVERVVYGDGKTDKPGFMLTKCVIYASDKRRVVNYTFWRVQVSSLLEWKWNKQSPEDKLKGGLKNYAKKTIENSNNVEAETDVAQELNTAGEGDLAQASGNQYEEETTKAAIENNFHAMWVEYLVLWFNENPGVIRVIGRSCARVHLSGLKFWNALQYVTVLWGADEGMWASSALVHAIDTITGRSVGRCYLDKPCIVRPAVVSLAVMAWVLRQMKELVPPHMYSCVELQKVKKSDLQDVEKGPYT